MEERRQVGVGRLVAPLVAQRTGPEPVQRAEQVHLEAELLFRQATHLAEDQAQFLLGGGQHGVGRALAFGQQGSDGGRINRVGLATAVAAALAFGLDLVGHQEAVDQGWIGRAGEVGLVAADEGGGPGIVVNARGLVAEDDLVVSATGQPGVKVRRERLEAAGEGLQLRGRQDIGAGRGAGVDNMHILADVEGNHKLALRRNAGWRSVWYNGRGHTRNSFR